jgi:hypothetical protein
MGRACHERSPCKVGLLLRRWFGSRCRHAHDTSLRVLALALAAVRCGTRQRVLGAEAQDTDDDLVRLAICTRAARRHDAEPGRGGCSCRAGGSRRTCRPGRSGRSRGSGRPRRARRAFRSRRSRRPCQSCWPSRPLGSLLSRRSRRSGWTCRPGRSDRTRRSSRTLLALASGKQERSKQRDCNPALHENPPGLVAGNRAPNFDRRQRG